jgi:hypothetical protein
MKHLSREELIDSLEHVLPPAREAHAEACATCRAERASLQEVLHRVAEVEVPEPSPLFWEHFSAHVRDQVAQQPQPTLSGWPAWATLSGWSTRGWPKWAAGAATLLICVTLGWAGWRDYQRGHHTGAGMSAGAYNPPGTPLAPDQGSPLDSSPDEDWNLVVSMAEDVTVEDADDPRLAVKPGSAERALTDLSSEQRSELARLLTAEMLRPAS